MYKARPPSAAVAQVVVISLILSLAGCAANQTTHTGYLGDYAALVSGSDSKTAVYLRPGLTPGDFKQLSVDMVAFAGSSPRVAGLSDEERNTLKSHLMQSLQRVMSPAEPASSTPSTPPPGSTQTAVPPRSARLRAAITDFDAPNVAMNVVMAVVLIPLSTGGASMEFEVRDAGTDQRLLAMTCSDAGSVTTWQGMKDAFGRLDHAKAALDACTQRLAMAWHGPTWTPAAPAPSPTP